MLHIAVENQFYIFENTFGSLADKAYQEVNGKPSDFLSVSHTCLYQPEVYLYSPAVYPHVTPGPIHSKPSPSTSIPAQLTTFQHPSCHALPLTAVVTPSLEHSVLPPPSPSLITNHPTLEVPAPTQAFNVNTPSHHPVQEHTGMSLISHVTVQFCHYTLPW